MEGDFSWALLVDWQDGHFVGRAMSEQGPSPLLVVAVFEEMVE